MYKLSKIRYCKEDRNVDTPGEYCPDRKGDVPLKQLPVRAKGKE